MILKMTETKADIVIGSRYCKGGKSNNGIILKFFSKIVNGVYSVAFKLKVKDVSNSFRLYKTEYLKGLALDCNNFDIVEEILVKLNLFNEDLLSQEIPINFLKRNEGKSKRKLFKFIVSYLKTLLKLKKFERSYKKEKRRSAKANG